ncbi:hypothetical protein V8G54_027426 [Vigna mungo]|uniref:Uncharacterized protein n=1 Tax=Vigna mungo TaxID=3915 RepID=A0AAQ3N2H9_VIGMU
MATSIETKMEAPTTARVFATDPMTLAALAASGASAVAVGPLVTTAPAAFPALSVVGAAAVVGDTAAVAAEAVVAAATKKSARRRTTAKEVKEIRWDAIVNGEKENECFWEVLGFNLFIYFFGFSEEKRREGRYL